MSEFKDIFAEKRRELGLSQGDIAKRLHVTTQAVSKWERGKSMPDMALLGDLAELFGITVDELLTGRVPEKQIEIVEREVIREVEKPLQKRKLIAILVPILVLAILASALMGVYIPKTIANDKPPVTENPGEIDLGPFPPIPETPWQEDPFIELTEISPLYSSETDVYDPTGELKYFNAKLQNKAAYYVFETKNTSDYTFKIAAPLNAKVQFDGEGLPFDGSEDGYFGDNEERTYNAYLTKEKTYKIKIDLSECEDVEFYRNNQRICVQQKLGYDNVIVRANSEYAFAIPRSEGCDVQRLFLDDVNFKFVRFGKTFRVMDSDSNDVKFGSCVSDGIYNPNLFDLKEGVSSIEVFLDKQRRGDEGDYICVVKNTADVDLPLQIRKENAEEIQIGQRVNVSATDTLPKYYRITWDPVKDPNLYIYHTFDKSLVQNTIFLYNSSTGNYGGGQYVGADVAGVIGCYFYGSILNNEMFIRLYLKDNYSFFISNQWYSIDSNLFE